MAADFYLLRSRPFLVLLLLAHAHTLIVFLLS